MRHFLIFPLWIVASSGMAQSVSGPWRTLRTTHYRIHYPDREGFPAFAAQVASRIEGIHAQYLEQIGWRFEGVQDVLIGDPTRDANGSAWPFLKRPYVWLWATPPEEESIIGHHRGWEELLVSHELGHMHHLLRPQRGLHWWERFQQVVGPVTQKSPRWVIEGYATVLEGRITGSGRPHSVQRAAVLRTWAREGRLPAYEALNGDQGYMGGAMAYLVGSAYLEWLEGRAPQPRALQVLWKQLASTRRRSFEKSFSATFGFSAQEGYARFRAELSHDALREEARLRAAGLVEGEIFAKVEGHLQSLALSPDGTKLLARLTGTHRPGVVVWDLRADLPKPPEPSKDPEEPTDVAPQVPRRNPTWVLPPLDGALARRPRWSADGKAVLFDQPLPDPEGRLRMHPRRWVMGEGVFEGTQAEATPFSAVKRGESDGTWNLVDASGHPLTRTLSAMWSPTQAALGGPLYALRLTSTGVEVRRFPQALTPLVPLPSPAETLRTEGTVRRSEDEPSHLPAPVTPPAARPYRVSETLQAFSIQGLHAGPWGQSLEWGLGFNDFLGRLNGFVLGAVGSSAGPRGGAAGLRYEGFSTPLQLQVYSALERPSQQALAPLVGFDRERRGAEAAISTSLLGRTTLEVGFRFFTEQEERWGTSTFHRHAFESFAKGRLRRSRGEWAYHVGIQGRSTEGRTEALHWSRERSGGELGLDTPWVNLSVTGEYGFMEGDASPTDRFALGGAATSLVPVSAEGARVVQPGLPAYAATGDRFRRWRGTISLSLGELFVEHTALWLHTDARPAYLRVAGWELDGAKEGLTSERLQGLVGRVSFRLGLYRILDGPLRHRTTGSLGISLHL